MRHQNASIGNVAVITLMLAPLCTVSAHANTSADYKKAHALYGEEIAFDVYRNGTLVGEQTVDFSTQKDELAVDINFHLTVKALYITFYKMTYSSKSLWQDGNLVSLTARTDRNGDKTAVDARAKGSNLIGNGPAGEFSTPLGIYPTDHWNAGVIGSTKLVNTINGRVNDIRLVPVGPDKIKTNQGVVDATHYKYQGEIKNDVWYDAAGRWVHMSFFGDDGSLIEFRCRQCIPSSSALAD